MITLPDNYIVEDELCSLTAWGTKLLCSPVVRQRTSVLFDRCQQAVAQDLFYHPLSSAQAPPHTDITDAR